ncbi:MAG: zinc-ribbon domain-containing protein [Lachnobacterium sp.]|nr:zinc-ribbon domain-containing protein [Lachnobacterium sp.]
MFCSKCGKELPENSVFCPQCGTNVKGNLFENSLAEQKERKPSGTLIKTIATIAVILIAIRCFVGWLSNPDYEQMVKSGKLQNYNYGETIEESLSDWFGGNVTWDSYEENDKVYVTASGVCPYMTGIYNSNQTFIFSIVDDKHFRFNGAYDSDGNEIFTDCSSNFLNAYVNVFTPYMDSDFHEMAIKAAFGDQESLNVFKKAEESGNTENQESQNNVNEDTVEAEENAEEDGIDNYVRYDFLYGDDGCELKAMLFYQQKNSGVIAFEYIDYEDESNSKNINGTFEEDENGNGSILMETGDQLDYVVDLYSYPTSLTITLQDGSDLIMMDYDWSLENAG